MPETTSLLRFETNRFWPDPGNASPLARFFMSLGSIAVAAGFMELCDKSLNATGAVSILGQSGQMLSTAVESGLQQAYGWGFWLGVSLLVIAHGVGYIVGAKAMGLKLKALAFMPFLGGMALLKGSKRDMWREAMVALSGPIFGSIFAVLASLLYHITGGYIYLAIAYFGYFFNLLCLMPILFFDGNRVVAGLPKIGWIFGVVLLAAMEIGLYFWGQAVRFNAFPVFVLACGLPQMIHSLLGRPPQRCTECAPFQQVMLMVLYFGLVVALGWMSSISFEQVWTTGTPEAMGD